MNLHSAQIAIVGATGAVGVEMLDILAQRGIASDNVRAIASARSAGRRLEYGAASLEVEALEEESFRRTDVALFAASSDAAREWAPRAVAAGSWVVDNSSAFRMDPNAPLVVPEVNPGAIDICTPRIVANPNCSTIIMLMALTGLHRTYGCERMVISTYQAVSGAGAAAMDELIDQSRASLDGGTLRPKMFSEPCAFNVFSHDSAMDPQTGRNAEEEKMIRETHKIWNDPSVRISATCIRVPVLRAHTESINVTLRRPASVSEVRECVAGFPGVRLLDDRVANAFPTPLKASGLDDVLVGRIRPDAGSEPDDRGRHHNFDLLVCGDQLRKGAALNAIQIADLLPDRA